MRDEDQKRTFIEREASRAPERARLAARPSNNWLVTDRFKLEAMADDAPKPIKQKRGPGRPPKEKAP